MKNKTCFKFILLMFFLLTNLTLNSFAQKIPSDVDATKSTKAEVIYLEKGELTAKDITHGRNMAKYDDGSYFDCRGWISKDDSRGECDENTIRDFIWSHWTEKKFGYIRVTYNSVDAQSTSHIFIEPNDKGKWRIARRIVRFHAIPEMNNQITEVQTLFQVEKVENKNQKENWTIVLKDKYGKVIYKIPEL